jgi:beta-glucanase (GH16 family)
MKKILILIMSIGFLMYLFSCTTEVPEETIISEPTPTPEVIGQLPVFEGLSDVTYYVGQSFDPKYGISAMDPEDGNITNQIYVLGLENVPLTSGKLTEMGSFDLTYIIIDSDFNWVTEIIKLTVIEPVINSDCDVEREGYRLTWCDDFSGIGSNVNERGVDLDKWGFQLGTGSQYGLTNWGNNEQQFYRSENATVSMGQLVIEAKKEIFGGMPYTSSRLFTQFTFSQTYGRFEAMIRLPAGEGLWPAFWLMPKDSVYGGWANSGEIDIMEARGRLPGEISSALHYGGSWPNRVYTSKRYTFQNGQTIEEDHLYAVEWDETEIRFYVNDVLYHTVTQWFNTGYDYPAPFDQPFYIIINLAVGGGFDGNRLPPASLFDEPVEMVVSFVRVYQRVAN